MKVKLFIITCIISIGFSSCLINKPNYAAFKQKIDATKVDFIEMRNQSQNDTVINLIKKLTAEETKIFIEKWNNADALGPCKFIPLYVIDIQMEDGTKRKFRLNGRNIKETNDDCFNLGDNNYIEQLWNNGQ
jgi:hypothetical protein